MDEAAQWEGAPPARRQHCKASSEGLNLERKEEPVEMWLLVRGGGGELDISAVAKFSLGAAKNWRPSVVAVLPMDYSRRNFWRKPYMRVPLDILYSIAQFLANKLFVVYLIFSL
jgi:hypothetical protein